MFSVVITEKGGAQRRIDFDKNEVTIGRVQGNDIILPKGNVSKRHSRIVLKDNRFIVVDLKSTNGTYVNGRKITSPLVVKSGDKIYIGDFILTLEEAAGVVASPPGAGDMGAPPPPGLPPPGPPQMGGPPPGPPPQQQMPPQQMAPQQQMPPQQMGGPPPPLQPQMGAPPPLQPQGQGRPPPLRSAPPPPRQPTLGPGGAQLGGPPPLPGREAPRVPSEPPPPGAGAERYPLDEEPADETMAPSPRVVAAAPPRQPTPSSRQDFPAAPKEAAPPSASPTDMPPRAAAPSAPAVDGRSYEPRYDGRPMRPARRTSVPRARDPRDPLGHVLATLGDTIDIGSLVPPEALEQERWREVRTAADAAIQRLEREGGNPGDRDSLANAAVQEALGLGPIAALLEDPGVLEIVIEGPSTILVDRGSGLSAVPGRFSSADQLTTIVGRLVTRGGGTLDGTTAMVEATLPSGEHLIAILPPVALRGPVVEIRRTGRAPVTGESLVQHGMLTNDMLATLRAAVEARRNIVVVGASEVGVGSVVSMIANLAHSDDRVLSIEASPELALAAPHAVRLSASSGVALSTLLAQAPRLRSDRLVLDGVSGPETREALLLLASRGAGCVLGVRSSPTGPALDHLEALAGLDGHNHLAPLLAAAVHVLVRVGRDANGVRRIVLIAEVTHEGSVPTAHEIFSHQGEFQGTGRTPSFAR